MKMDLLMSKIVNIKITCFICLIWFVSSQSAHAQKDYFADKEKEIYASSLTTLKFNNDYSNRFAIDSKLLSYISYYVNGNPNHLIATYIRENNWNFIKQADLTKITKPFKIFQSKKILNYTDSVITYDKSGGFNVFSPVVYDSLKRRCVVFYQHNEKNDNHSYFGILFFERQPDSWRLIKNLSQFEIE